MSFIWIIPSDLPANRAVRPSWQARASIHVTSLGKRGHIAPSTDLLETRAPLACLARACLQFFLGCCAPTLMMSSLTFAIASNGWLAIGYKHPTQQCFVHSCLLPISFALDEISIECDSPVQDVLLTDQGHCWSLPVKALHMNLPLKTSIQTWVCRTIHMWFHSTNVVTVHASHPSQRDGLATCCLAIFILILNIWFWIQTISSFN